MVVLKIFSISCAILLAGHAGSTHIKRNHRQCPPRLTSSAEEAVKTPSVAVALHGYSSRPFIPHPISSTSTLHTTSSTHISSTSISSVSKSLSSIISAPPHSTATPSPPVITTLSIVTPATKTSTTQAASPTSRSLIPNNVKAGIAGGDAYPYMKDHIGWWYDWSPNPSKPGSPIAVPMLWGDGTVDAQDAQRLKAFENLATVPPYVLGFEEPDCPSGSGSAGMSVEDGVSKWESLIAPLGAKGAKLGSPSMCKQIDETWLAEFQGKISKEWDFTAVHINKNNMDGVKEVEHYMAYGKPIWVTEFACVDDSPDFIPCTDQGQINDFIQDVVPYFESNPNVYAYAYSNGLGLGDVWPLMNGDSLSESGKTYLAAISQYH
ncbi:hypothetical protein GALMADRAFT_1290695 [Galerina marginata CBS 339.88]|uniref:Asl1-like glycosyl hydrolase catalytic domain-containing protein n=1 Tax=Galerina marginata (strain CBS 339.88) TaxID=685588 RepID=A0A067TJB0_GALM3|nr:hypothetical protein GALMADRAFT_1290695 [Galerina marginata CBS 339.88]